MVQIDLITKKGWEIKRITYYANPTYKDIDNNEQVAVSKEWTRIRYILENKKGEEVGIDFNFGDWDDYN